MLNKRTAYIKTPLPAVKKLGRSIALVAAAGTLAIANASFANPSLTTEQVITFEIQMSDFDEPNGTAKVYEKLKAKAKRVCRADRSTLDFYGQTVSECTQDLLVQFVASAGLPNLQSYHSSQSPL